MHYNYKLSVIVPSIHPEALESLYEQTCRSVKKHSFEFIVSSPYALPSSLQKVPNVKCVKSFGSPAKSLALAHQISEGEFFTWIADDAAVKEDGLDECLDLLLSKRPYDDIISIRYRESVGRSLQSEFPLDYFRTHYHADLRQPAIPDMNFALVMMLSQELYNKMGGIDCRYMHLNMQIIKFSIEAQIQNGSQLHLSPCEVMNCGFTDGRTVDNSPVIRAFWENDRGLFYDEYKDANVRPKNPDINDWRKEETVWRFGKF